MLFSETHISDIDAGPITFIRAADEISEDSAEVTARNDIYIYEAAQSLPCSSDFHIYDDFISIRHEGAKVQSRLINDVSRYCEHNASDIITLLSYLQPFLTEECDFKDHRWVLGAGIREDGVDGNECIIKSLANSLNVKSGSLNVSSVYRKIDVIDIHDVYEFNHRVHRLILLKDITHHLYKLDDSDIIRYSSF